MKKVEEMAHFFNRRAAAYNEHMRESIGSFKAFYESIAKPIEKTYEEIEVLVLGCGTGVELAQILKKAPKASITGVDVSEKMLALLKEEYREYGDQIQVIEGSYLSYPLEEGKYDFIVGVMTMHHLLALEKRDLYGRIKKGLKREGLYIEGDYVVSKEKELELLKEYHEKRRMIGDSSFYHIDIPFSIETQKEFLLSAGFSEFNLLFYRDEVATYSAKKKKLTSE